MTFVIASLVVDTPLRGYSTTRLAMTEKCFQDNL
jgi:hypothetical protein